MPSAQGEATSARIRRAAMHLIGQQGFAAMSMRQLAVRVGVQAGSLYRYFPSKHCLLFELLCEQYHDLLTAWQHAQPVGSSVEHTLGAFVEHHLTWHEERHRQGALLDPLEVRSLAGRDRAMVLQLARRYHEQLQRLIESGVRQGCFRCTDVALVGDAILTMLQGACRDGTEYLAIRRADYRLLTLKLLS
ncbi:TetR family transcriptional regulator [Pseudomonas sp. CAU 1711]|uniref:TetR/AcrR family transcriptional regulator n=1 Tax=Pseudomonas sp. CAU 1711 TaxID=3140356 RepID=UPI003261AA97